MEKKKVRSIREKGRKEGANGDAPWAGMGEIGTAWAVPPVSYQKVPVGFGPVDILPGQTLAISNTLQVRYMPEALFIDSACAGAFVISDFKVGHASQWVAERGVPAVMFATGQGLPLLVHRVEIGQLVRLVVANISEEKATFCACLMGLAVTEGA